MLGLPLTPALEAEAGTHGDLLVAGVREHCTVLYCTVLYCTVLYCTVLHCTVLHLVAKLAWHCCSVTCSHTTSVSPESVQPCQLCLNILYLSSKPLIKCGLGNGDVY